MKFVSNTCYVNAIINFIILLFYILFECLCRGFSCNTLIGLVQFNQSLLCTELRHALAKI